MLGDCCRMDNASSAIAYFEESVELLSKLPKDDLEVLDVAVSLAKVADTDRNLGDEKLATSGFQNAIELFESMTLNSEACRLWSNG
ncbi:hypothetical protein TanjilG_02821 [Lupinus angustifolius]|uniref:Uncharacterized protein n=1 Tax=Lupinus angustifolius TaxID=3871 RepID=A0A4P1RM24_LUPAN|nr:hypothetical protein TanjilG_02821 [Lupinus angustifolius]